MPRVKAKDGRKEDSRTRENLSCDAARAGTAEAVVMAARIFGASLRSIREHAHAHGETRHPRRSSMRFHDNGEEKKDTYDGWTLSTAWPHGPRLSRALALAVLVLGGVGSDWVTASISMHVPAVVTPNSSASASCSALRIVSTSMSVFTFALSWAALMGEMERQR